jgi:beta-glucosidase
MIQAIHHFPKGFLWGTATSSHQVEGGNEANDWWAWEAEDGRISEGHRSGQACDWWGGRWQEDLDRAAEAGQNAHRLSIEWSRVEPEPGVWDESALDHYEEIVSGALDRGLMPMVTLHHFTSPMWLMDQGGWVEPDVISLFERYVRRVVDRLKDRVGIWVTINEPNVYAYNGYSAGVFPPGEHDLSKTVKVMATMTRAHVAAYRVIHTIQPGALVGMAHHYRGMRANHANHPLERLVTNIRSGAFNNAIPHALRDGVFRLLWTRERIPEAAGTQDFIGLNYYTEEYISFRADKPADLFSEGRYSPRADLSPKGFIANEPQGFWRALNWAHGFRLPIYVTENGTEDAHGGFRPRYLASHIRQLWRAANLSWQVAGYFHWSLVDNFEWERGWTQRWGLWALDPDTQERTPRPSKDLYAEICHENGLSSEMVARYAPEVLAELFPVDGPGQLAAGASF